MLYRHERSGAVIDVNSAMGGRWKPVKASGASSKPAAPKTAKPKKQG